MKISQKGIKLIKEFEGCYLHAYKDAVGVVTIGYGITNADKAITGKTIKMGMTISQATADWWLKECLDRKYAPLVMKYDSKYHWNQNQFDSLVSFCYNIGSIDQLTAKGTRSIGEIAAKMLQYNKAGGKALKGLARRREAEHKLFCTPVEKRGYSGKFPELPKRGYYKLGDGYVQLRPYSTQIERTQRLINWVMNFSLVDDGEYGRETVKAVTRLQERFGLEPNGCFGNKCLKACKNFKK